VLPNGTPIFVPFNLVSARPICPDFRSGRRATPSPDTGVDYDEKALAGFSQNSTAPEFMLAFSDSSKGCVNQSEFTSTHLHVSTVVFK